ncbi:unnamed protein product, partial [Iphiclides podalirius]
MELDNLPVPTPPTAVLFPPPPSPKGARNISILHVYDKGAVQRARRTGNVSLAAHRRKRLGAACSRRAGIDPAHWDTRSNRSYFADGHDTTAARERRDTLSSVV